MPSNYAKRRTQKVLSRNHIKPKFTIEPEHNIPVVINSKLTVYINDESKREETIRKYRSKHNE